MAALLGGVLVASCASLGWLAYELVRRANDAGPQPPEDVGDPFSVPEDEVNGWAVLADADDTTFDLDPPVIALFDRQGTPNLEGLEANRSQILAWSGPTPVVAQALAAFARPRFVRPCGLKSDERQPCPAMPWVHAHHVVAQEALRSGLEGRYDEALGLTEDLARSDGDAVRNARSMVDAMIAILGSRVTIEVSALVSELLAADANLGCTPELADRLRSVRRAVSALDPSTWSLRRPLSFTWIDGLTMLDDVRGDRSTGRIDPHRATREVGLYYEAAILYAGDPEHVEPPVPPRADWLFRIEDPLGATLIEGVANDWSATIEHFHDSAERAEPRWRIALGDLRSAAARCREEDTSLQPE